MRRPSRSRAACNTLGSTDSGRLLPYAGDQNGGKIPNGFNNVPAAMNTARVHCAKYNKKAIVTQMDSAAAGGLVAFQCL